MSVVGVVGGCFGSVGRGLGMFLGVGFVILG